jgi:hypothetical protein
MKYPHLPSGLKQGLPFLISADWSAEQALAVVELLDDLRELIWAHYQFPLQELLREQRLPDPGVNNDDPQF